MKRDVAIVGAGYVGLPLAHTFAEAGRTVLLLDVDAERVAQLNRGESYIEDVASDGFAQHVEQGRIAASTDYDELAEADAILIALPTPLSRQREPDLSILLSAAAQIAPRLRKGHLVVLESTTYPGTTREQLLPVLEEGQRPEGRRGLPPRVLARARGPGRQDWSTKSVPKVVGGIDEASTEAAAALYGSAIDTLHLVSSPEAAELTKLLENIFRSVNIALVNELAQLCDRMDIDVWEVDRRGGDEAVRVHVVQAGPGARRPLHPDRPLLSHVEGARVRLLHRVHRARGEGQQVHAVLLPLARLAGAEPHAAAARCRGSRILVLGVAYKPDIADMRESPAVKLIELLQNAGADVSYHDPHVPEFEEHGVS